MGKRFALKASGLLAGIGLPMIPVIYNWGFLTTTDAQTTVSGAVIACLIICIPVIKNFISTDKIMNINVMWVAIAALGLLGMYVGKQMVEIGTFGAAGSVVSTAMYKVADKVKATELQNKNNDKMASLIKESLGVSAESK